MRRTLLVEAQGLISTLPRGGKADLASRLGWPRGRITALAAGRSLTGNRIEGTADMMVQKAIIELRKMAPNAKVKGGA